MAKLTDIPISVEKDGVKLSFTLTVNVDREGMFRATLPADVAKKLQEEYGMKLSPNILGNAGFFINKTFDGLRSEVEGLCREALSRKLVEEKLVIKYDVKTLAIFGLTSDGEIIPNGYWADGQDYRWVNGNGPECQGSNYFAPRLEIFVKVYDKKTYEFASGKKMVEYTPYFAPHRGGSSVDWINNVVRMIPINHFNSIEELNEVDATEQNAAFFVQMLKFVFKAAALFAQFAEPEKLLDCIAKGPKLLDLQ